MFTISWQEVRRRLLLCKRLQVLQDMLRVCKLAWCMVSLLRHEVKGRPKMNRRQRMYQTNKLAKKWLFQNDYDFIWLKPHLDNRRNHFKDWYHTKAGSIQQTDIYNLFDGFCFDHLGYLVFLQISTTNFHGIQPYEDFIMNKKGISILMLKAVKTKNKWIIKTKSFPSPTSFIFKKEKL